MDRICPRCGRKVEKLINGLCLDCYREINKVEEKIYRVKYCVSCGKYFFRNKKYDSVDFLKKYEIEKFVCRECSLLHSRSYNLILQIRNIENYYDIIKFAESFGYIKDIKEVGNGVDIFILNRKRNLKKLLEFLKKNKFKYKITRKLIKVVDGKRKYRVTVLITKN